MRVILDTNSVIAALITRATPPDRLYEAWRDGVRFRINPAAAGCTVNDFRRLATVVDDLPDVEVSADPYDNFLLALAQVAQADLLVTGDKRGLLALNSHRGTQILSAREALELVQHP
jgi:predicted nucleic acid-binding protein